MTKGRFLNSWAKELAIESTMSDIDAKKFLHAFYDKVIGFNKQFEPEMNETRLAEIFANHADHTPYLNFDSFKDAIKELLNR